LSEDPKMQSNLIEEKCQKLHELSVLIKALTFSPFNKTLKTIHLLPLN